MLAEWTTEAAMRIGVPLLTVGHAMLAMALVLGSGNITGRRGAGGARIIIALPAAHIAFLVIWQSLLRADARFALLLAASRRGKSLARPGLSRASIAVRASWRTPPAQRREAPPAPSPLFMHLRALTRQITSTITDL